MSVIVASQDARAVDPAKRQAPSLAQNEEARLDENQGDMPQVEDNGVRERHADQERGEAFAIPPRGPRHRSWYLGVRCQYLDTGARVTFVSPNSAAWRVGLEPRDVIISVDGYQIGYVNRRLYEISDELNARAGRSGRVRLLVQNWRNNELLNVDVQLTRIGPGLPRERFDRGPERFDRDPVPGAEAGDEGPDDREGGGRN